ncbi:MAG: ethanolamine utilization protein EutH [Oscillospiraceae bacterium]|nr:ethanolamine utilization protein EutH [Oscillospiraceae bacterium]
MQVVNIVIVCFAALGAIDYLIGNKFGLGNEFVRGILMIGTCALSSVGIIILSPFISDLLSPVLKFISDNTPLDPSIISACLLANDMGGAPLSESFGKTAELGSFNGLVVGAMMGATTSFTLPLALSLTKKEQHGSIMLGLMCGIIAIPFGVLVSALMVGLTLSEILSSLIPLIIFAALLTVGLLKVPELCLKAFKVLGIFVKILAIVGLLGGMVSFLTGYELIPNLAPFEDSMMIGVNAAVVLSGTLPLLFVVQKLIKKPLDRLSAKMDTNPQSMLGLVANLATNITTFSMMEDMDEKGVVLNSAFSVSGAFVFGAHLAFTLAYKSEYLAPVIVGKLVAGAASLVIANILYKLLIKKGKI